jgi:hypothetical protein
MQSLPHGAWASMAYANLFSCNNRSTQISLQNTKDPQLGPSATPRLAVSPNQKQLQGHLPVALLLGLVVPGCSACSSACVSAQQAPAHVHSGPACLLAWLICQVGTPVLHAHAAALRHSMHAGKP